MKHGLAIILILLALTSPVAAGALPGTLPLDRSYLHAPTQAARFRLADVIISKPPGGKRYLEAKGDRTDFVVGKQSYLLGNGLVAGISGVCGVKTSFESGGGRATLFFGDNGQPMFAGEVTTASRHRKLVVGAAYFKVDDPYMGVSVVSRLNKDITFNVGTSENLYTLAKGYLVQLQYGQAQKRGDVAAAVSYRYVEPGSISGHSAYADWDDSKGVRLETTCKLTEDLALTLGEDFAATQENFDKSSASASLTWEF